MAQVTESEARQRRLAVENAIGTHAIEGIGMDPAARRLMDAFADGRMTLAEFSQAMDACAASLVKGDRALQGAASC